MYSKCSLHSIGFFCRRLVFSVSDPGICDTHPAYRIQEYAIRKNARGGRDGCDGSLKNLPRTIEMMLTDFVEDLIGYRTEEAQVWRKACILGRHVQGTTGCIICS
ncbi:hypothetical protein ANCCAN_18565 [Ancylostoma caninum]|uniref:Uncharacterized protein n=1 Tax=Ancylostoma caninum TaxID=29170 RepID=A0A368FU02_ANCCA|nr:hypothetical protein ANCCAN_18565 [Ancylostoma caninum]